MGKSSFSVRVEVQAVEGYRYRLPFTEPVRLGEAEHTHRKGLLVRIKAEDAEGWGDVAPLPAFSHESLDMAVDACRTWAASVQGLQVGVSTTKGQLVIEAKENGLPPSAAFGVESAAVELAARRGESRVPALLASAPRSVVSMNALLDGAPEAMLREAESLRRAGYTAVKIKVGRRDWETEARLVRRVHDVLGRGGTLRLDANRAWKWADAVAFAEGIHGVPVAYVEEPLADPAHLAAFAETTGLRVALDETVREMSPADLADRSFAEAVVLKPALTGLSCTLRWMQSAAGQGVQVVFSSAYESGIGMRMLIALAAAAAKATPAGFGPYRRLASDVLRSRLSLDGPTVDVDGATAERPDVEVESLERVF